MDNRTIQYFDGELSGEELAAFEKLMVEDEAIPAELERLELAKAAIQHYGLKQQVAAMHGRIMGEVKGVQKQPEAKVYQLIRSTMKIAAGLFLFMFLFAVYEFTAVSPTNVAKSRPYELSIERGISAPSVIEQAYLKRDYNGTISLLQKVTSPNVKEKFIGGQAYLAVNSPANAIDEFNKVLNDPSGGYHDDAEYYLALSYLQNDDLQNAKKYLDKIHMDNGHLYHDQVSSWMLFKLNLLILKNKL